MKKENTLKLEQEFSVTAGELQKLLKAASAVVVDVRSVPEFSEGHIKNAVHLPIEGLPGSVTLPKSGRIVTVCNKGGGRSEKAAELLRSHGWNAVWLKDGYFGWRDSDLPRVEVGGGSS